MYLTLSRLIVALEQCHVLVQRFRLEMSAWRLQCAKSGMELFSTNCDSSVHYRVRWRVLQNCESLFITTRHDLLQNATGITRCVETQTAKWPQYIDSIFCYYLIISHNSTELP